MKSRKLAAIAFYLAAATLLALGLAPTAQAGRLKAQIYLLQNSIPNKLSERALIGFARAHANKLLRETNDKELKKRKWVAQMVVSFNSAVDDMEFEVLFYDIQDGPRRFVEDMSTMINDRKEKTFVQKITLSRPQFKPNRRMELVVTVRRAEVGRLKFGVIGQEKRRSGEVSFSDSER